MKVSLLIFFFGSLAMVDLVTTAQSSRQCHEETCRGNFSVEVLRCENECDIGMARFEFTCTSFDPPPNHTDVSGIAVTNSEADSTTSTTPQTEQTNAPAPTAAQQSNVSANATSAPSTNTTGGITHVYCVHCPENCEECRYNSASDTKSCTKCTNKYELNDSLQCVQKPDESSSDNKIAIVVGCVLGGLALVIVTVVIIWCVKRKRRSKADVSGQCQLRVVSSDQLSEGKPKVVHSVSTISDATELDKLPMAPPPPAGYDQLGIAEQEQLDYEPFDASAAHKDSKSESANPENQENVYMNMPATNSNKANAQRPPVLADRSCKPTNTRTNVSGPASPQMDNIYTNLTDGPAHPQNNNVSGSGLNDSEAPLQMDDIYINENVEEVRRPSASKSKRSPKMQQVKKAEEEPASPLQMDDIYINENVEEVRRPSASKSKRSPKMQQVEKAEEEPASLVQDDFYYNDPAQGSPSGAENFYEVPEGGAAQSRQSDIYINASPDSIYQNMK